MNEQEKPRSVVTRLFSVNAIGAVLLLGATALSLYQVMRTHEQLFDPNTTIIRFSHWQLERGYSDALQRVIDEYERMWAAKGKKVKVLQQPVTEKVYPQWLNTHMIAGDAPDISEMGMSGMLNNATYTARYYMPLTTIANKPNPYNAGTNLASVAWRETFIDGMRGTYNTTLQDYYGVPTAFFTTRLFYNMDMLKAATGSDAPPQTMGQLLDVCAKLKEYGKRRQAEGGDALIPIAGSKYSSGIFIDRYLYPFTAGYEQDLDVNLEGQITDRDAYIGFLTKKVSFDDPQVKAFYECLHDLASNFAPGFYSMERQDAAFAFIQERSCMIATGSWDASSLFNDPDFRVGVFDFPLPAPNESHGQYVLGRGNEAGVSAGDTFGIYKFSRNTEQALDFLHFLTSQKCNQQMMRDAQWIPAIIGTSPSPKMMPFAADPTGFSSKMNFFYGSSVQDKFNGKMQTYLEGQQPYEALCREIYTALMDPKIGGDAAWYLEWDDEMVQLRSQERVMAVQTMRELVQHADDAPLRYRQLMLQQVRANDCEGTRYRFQQVRGKPLQDPAKTQ